MTRAAALALLLAGCGQAAQAPANQEAVASPASSPSDSPAAVSSPVSSTSAVAAPAPPPMPAALSDADLRAYPEARGMPADVQRLLVRHADCEHWAGEEPYDAARRAEIERGVADSCTGVDAETEVAKRRHRDDARVAAKLDALERMGM